MAVQYVDVRPHPGGFGYYQAAGRGDVYADLADLLYEVHQDDADVFALDEGAVLPPGVEDIRGMVHNAPDLLYAVRRDDGHVQYFGVDELEGDE